MKKNTDKETVEMLLKALLAAKKQIEIMAYAIERSEDKTIYTGESTELVLAYIGRTLAAHESNQLEEIEVPILVGHTTKAYGTKGNKTVEIGSPVYEFQNRYFIEQGSLTTSKIERVKFYKEDFRPFVRFIESPDSAITL